MFTPLNEKVVVLTGASKGIGRGMALRFAQAGAKLLLINRSEQEGQQLVDELRSQGHIAHAIAALFLGSQEAGFITEQTLVIDGGQVLPEVLM